MEALGKRRSRERMKRNPKVLRDLLDSGISIEKVREAWSKSKVKVETARNSRAICRICGKVIMRGQERVTSEDPRLVDLYGAFWSLKVYAHRTCYERFINPPGLPTTRSQYRRTLYCAKCGTWWPLKDLLNGDEKFPKREPDLLRCPFCSGVLRTRAHHSRRWDFPRIKADLEVQVEPFEGQRSLDEFLGDVSIITIKSGGVERKYVVK